MAAITKRLLHHRPYHHHPNPYPLHHFSSSSSSNNDSSSTSPIPQSDPNASNPNPNSGTYYDDVKSSLRQSPPPHRPFTFSNRRSPPPPPTSAASLEEIRRNLSEFRHRTAPPPPPSSTVSIVDLYNRNVPSQPPSSPPSKLRIDSIRESLRNLKSNPDKPSFSQYKETLKMKPAINITPPSFPSVFGREGTGGGFLGLPNHQELGRKLRMLRPEKKKGKWFSLTELNERLVKIREMEEKERSSKVGGDGFSRELREGILKLTEANAEKTREEKARKDSCEFF